MKITLSIEAQNCTENGLAQVLKETIDALDFVTSGTKGLEEQNNYGTEFRDIGIIPSCMSDEFWNVLGWKERRQIWRKKEKRIFASEWTMIAS